MDTRNDLLRSLVGANAGKTWPTRLSDSEAEQIVVTSLADEIFVLWNDCLVYGQIVTLHSDVLKALQTISANLSIGRYNFVAQTGLLLRFQAGERADGLLSFRREANRGGVAKEALFHFERCLNQQIKEAIALLVPTTTSTTIYTKVSFLATMREPMEHSQDPHTDFESSLLNNSPRGQRFIAFFPLSETGMLLQIWTTPCDESKVVFVPLGQLYIVPAETVHAGGFLLFGDSNERGHLYIWVDIAPDLVLKNEYFAKDNMLLANRYPRASVLKKLSSCWFKSSEETAN